MKGVPGDGDLSRAQYVTGHRPLALKLTIAGTSGFGASFTPSLIKDKDFLDWRTDSSCDVNGQLERWIVLPGLKADNRFPTHIHFAG